MLMNTNLFDYFEDLSRHGGAGTHWAARTPLRPSDRFDVKLVPRSPGWQRDAASLDALERVAREPWVEQLVRTDGGVELRLAVGWIEAAGGALQEGDGSEQQLTDLAYGQRFSVQFWDANATKALHVGHLRNLAIGNALAAALTQAGARVERRSLISDAGRSMGEAMAGVMKSGRHAQAWPDKNEKSDHFVGCCYADYVAGGRSFNGNGNGDGPAVAGDSLTRELDVRNDDADDLLRRVLAGDRQALELWYKTRAWVIAGQRKTLQRLGIAFDRVFFESDFLADAAELMANGLRDGLLHRRRDGVVIYPTEREDFDEFPLVRGDELPTQHMRALAYWMAAPGLEGMTSVQVCGSEWVSHVTCRRQLMGQLMPEGGRGMHPTSDIFHGMVSRQKRAITSSEEGALLIDELTEWLQAQIEADPENEQLLGRLGSAERVAGQVALGFFVPRPVTPRVDFQPEKLLDMRESPGWEIAQARAREGRAATGTDELVHDPDYRFAVVQSELHRRHLRIAVERLDPGPLARYVVHLARWYLEQERSEPVQRVVHTLLERGAQGLGLEGAG
ncbi:MAG TPA: arginine--tRNA ligase [Solirubrobacteraceae bacterium]|nr:arginine--tRNA ligase [Solirubrobacteraceae bacterium]